MSFDWRTEIEEGDQWDVPADRASSTRRRWPWLLLLFVALIATVGLIWRQAQERVADAEATVREGVLSSHALGRRAVAEQDSELFLTVLSGREADWSNTQRQLFRAGYVYEGAARRLRLIPLPGEPAVVDIAIGPELREATLVTRHNYAVSTAAGLTETVTLQQHYLYRRGTHRWLLSPPDDAFWGEQMAIEEGHIRVSFPARDATFAARLALVLDRRVDALCVRFEPDCRRGELLEIELSPVSDSLEPLPPDYPYRPGTPLVLPAPSLVGLPPSAEGASGDVDVNTTFLMAYVEPALTRALVEITGYDCCVGLIFFDALANRLAAEGRGGAPAVDRAVAFAGEPVSLRRFSRLWTLSALKSEGERGVPTASERAQAALFTIFLEEQYGVESSVLLQRLVGSGNFFAWLAALGIYDAAATTTPGAVVETAWHHFLFERANTAQEAAAPAPPEQLVHLLCRREADWHLYTYDPLSDEWVRHFPVPGPTPVLVPLPEDDGLVIFELLPSPRSSVLLPRLLYHGQSSRLEPTMQPLYLPPSDPQGATLAVWHAEEVGSNRGSPALVEPAQCAAEGDCATLPLPAIPFWSPDGSRALLWELGGREIQLTSRTALLAAETGSAPTVVGYGTWPFWADLNTIGLVQNGQEVVMRRLEEESFRRLVTLEMLAQVSDRQLPVTPAAAIHWVQPVYPSPAIRGDTAPLLFVVGVAWPMSRWTRHELLLVHADQSGQILKISPLFDVPAWSVQMPHTILSPDGRWLALNVALESGGDVRFVVYDLVADRVEYDEELPAFQAFHSYDWSGGGEWLARSGGDRLELIAPTEGGGLYRRFIPAAELSCGSVAWIER
ncbi:MAG: hypothetical protein R3272_09910 [Candidatus Promineifilaceae bacterium]|nr:hypothetical protein [Candidatus Promineifilaceae bacterium]